MSLVYRTDGAWGSGYGADLSAAQIDGNFYDIDLRLTDLAENPPEAVYPISWNVAGGSMSLAFSNEQVFTVTYTIPGPRWRGTWEPDTPYLELDFFKGTDNGIYFVLLDHTSAETFDPAAVDEENNALYREIVGPTGETTGIGDMTDVAITDAADGDMLVYNLGASMWVNLTPADVTLNLSVFEGDTGSGGVKGLVPAPEAGDAAAGKYLDASGGWSIPPGSGGGSSSLAGLSDVSIAGPSNGSLLAYQASDGKWHNVAASTYGGTITGVTAGTGLSGGGASGAVSVALASIADDRMLANVSGSSAAPTATTVTAFLDAVAGGTRGAILRRDATGWTILSPGTAGQYLKTGGTGADVSWDTPAGLGTITEVTAGTGLTGGGNTGSVELALDSIADQRLLANISGGSAAPIANTLTAILDDILGGNRGMVIYRGAAAWLALDPGTSGYFLRTNGVGADPSWAQIKGGAGGGGVGTSASIWTVAADLATVAALPACTYNNGTSGVGATLTGNSNGALSVDGVAVSVADRILVKDQSNLAHNGIYAVTTAGSGGAAFVLTRATDFDQTAEIIQGSAVAIIGGDTNTGTAWVQVTGGSITLGTTSIEFEGVVIPLPECAEGEVLGNPNSYDAPAVPTDLARMLRASLGDGTAGQVITSGGTGVDPAWDDPAGSSGATPNGSSGDILTSDGAGDFGTPITPASGIATWLATPSSANLASAITDETGSGALVFATSPALVTPDLGTPSAVTLTNATGLPVSTGISGLGSGVATFLATPSSANLASAITDETGSGALVFATSPTLVTPALGTPVSGALTNCTSIPVAQATGVLPAANGGAGTVNGIMKANGSGTVSAASAGTDYVAPAGAGLVFNLLLPIAGLMTNGELLVPDTIMPACSFPSGAAGSYGSSVVAATGSATITVKKNGVAFATFAWGASGTSATVTISSTTSFNGSSDKLSIEAPATADATLADIGINLAGTRS